MTADAGKGAPGSGFIGARIAGRSDEYIALAGAVVGVHVTVDVPVGGPQKGSCCFVSIQQFVFAVLYQASLSRRAPA